MSCRSYNFWAEAAETHHDRSLDHPSLEPLSCLCVWLHMSECTYIMYRLFGGCWGCSHVRRACLCAGRLGGISQELQWEPGCKTSSVAVLLLRRKRFYIAMPAAKGITGMHWWTHVLIQSRGSKCLCCEMKKKKALVSWDKAFCLRGKANEIISMTQHLVRMLHIYWVYSVASRYFPVVQIPYINHSYCIWIPCSLCVNCKSSAKSQCLSLTSIPVLFPALPNNLKEICWPVSLKTWK